MKRNYIYSEQELSERTNALQAAGIRVIRETPNYPYWFTPDYDEFIAKLREVEGVSISDCWDIDESCRNDERNPYCVVRYWGHVLRFCGDPTYFFIHPAHHNKGKYYLYDERDAWTETQYLKTELIAPQFIGVPTKKKIADWVEYLNAHHKEVTDYAGANSVRLADQERALLHNFPDAAVRRNGHGEACEIRFFDGPIEYTYERGERNFCRTYRANVLRLPSFEEHTTIKEKKNPTLEAVNRCLEILTNISDNPRDGLSDIPHYKLEQAISDACDLLNELRATINKE